MRHRNRQLVEHKYLRLVFKEMGPTPDGTPPSPVLKNNTLVRELITLFA